MRESLFVNLMKHSKKSYDSFQDELEDYIKVQKARGLEPKTCFRKMREEHLETCGYREEVDCRPRYRMSAQRLPCGAAQASPRPCSMWQTVGSQSPLCFPAQDSRLRLASLSPCQFPKACFSEKPVPVTLSQREWTCGSYGLDSRVHKHLFSGNSPSAPQAGHKQVREKRRRHPEDCRETSEEGPRRQRRRGSAEGALDPQVSVQRARATMEAEAAKLKNRKKRSQDVASKKEGRRRKRVKKEQGKERTEEEMLWDQSILGF